MSRTIVAIGEALWDVFPDRWLPGGAPCNVAFHAARLGDRGVIVTRVGDDTLGDELVSFLAERGVDVGHVQRDDVRPTGTVSVVFEDGEPRYTITKDVAWDYLEANHDAMALVRGADAICVGSLAQRSSTSRAAIVELVSNARGDALIVFDVNLRPPFVAPDAIDAMLRLADVVKLGDTEVAAVATMLKRPSLVSWLVETVGVRAVCVTKGANGAAITTSGGTISAAGVGIDTSRGDVVGAGDAFTAAVMHHLVRNATAGDALHAANRYAAHVAARVGAMPE